ncbi:hypothetical protein [Nonomuraea sp. B19D2]|uniref:hypothetical protein n=1 Tax=Nonomuraea sp. B19D2 TaxID=3159561 RepID=UPI0032DBD087
MPLPERSHRTPADATSTSFALLGRMAVADADGRGIKVRAARQQAILAVLLLRPGEVVTADRLMPEPTP